jgi:hypothetical protein
VKSSSALRPDLPPDDPGRRDPASFRDPAGFVFRRDGHLYRQINRTFATEWTAFLGSGLAQRLVSEGVLLEHQPAARALALDDQAAAVIEPRELPFISYPYEWSFSQLQDAALATLRAQTLASEQGFGLRDASAYNVQFLDGRPILIDHLSFAPLEPGQPWIAYRQFCQHFLAPLALAAHRDPRLLLLSRQFIDGTPLDLAAELLPAGTRFNLGLATHLHLQARAQAQSDRRATKLAQVARTGAAASSLKSATPRVSPRAAAAIIENLRRTIEKLHPPAERDDWSAYTRLTSYSEAAAASKLAGVEQLLRATEGTWVWDLGANTALFSRLAARLGRQVLAFDADHGAVDAAYRALRHDNETAILPLVMDLANPSPDLGWALRERRSLVARSPDPVVLALALVHHLAIGNNLPLPAIAAFLAQLGRELVIEFVPKRDPMVGALLAHRQDIFSDYSLAGFRQAFDEHFALVEALPIIDSARVLFHLRRRSDQPASHSLE